MALSKTLVKSCHLLYSYPRCIPCTGSASPSLNQITPPAVLFSYFFSTSTPSASFSSIAVNGTASIGSCHHEEKQRGLLAKLLLFVPGAITFGLGTWQIFRREDKIKVLDYRQKRLEMEPVKFNTISSNDNEDSLEFRRILCRGVFDETKSVFVGPRSRSISGVTENGFYVITPLIPACGDPESVQSPVLVNRGWVPRSWRDKSLNSSQDGKPEDVVPHSGIQGESTGWRFWSKKSKKDKEQTPEPSSIEVIGVVRGSEKPSIFVPANDPVNGQWFYVDVPAITHASGLPENAVYVEDINAEVNPSDPYPIQKDANSLIRSSVMPQDHLNYMLTWYSLSAAVTFMAYKRLKPRKSRR